MVPASMDEPWAQMRQPSHPRAEEISVTGVLAALRGSGSSRRGAHLERRGRRSAGRLRRAGPALIWVLIRYRSKSTYAVGHGLWVGVLRHQVLPEGAEGLRRSAGKVHGRARQSTLSHHMKTLRDAGVVVSRPEGTRCFVSLRPELEERFPGLLGAVLIAGAS
jgi:DNA-binding transcriptional ArsR family regulator